jgi:hypothetical protein
MQVQSYAPAERAATWQLHSPNFYSTPICTLWLALCKRLIGFLFCIVVVLCLSLYRTGFCGRPVSESYSTPILFTQEMYI